MISISYVWEVVVKCDAKEKRGRPGELASDGPCTETRLRRASREWLLSPTLLCMRHSSRTKPGEHLTPCSYCLYAIDTEAPTLNLVRHQMFNHTTPPNLGNWGSLDGAHRPSQRSSCKVWKKTMKSKCHNRCLRTRSSRSNVSTVSLSVGQSYAR